MILHLVRYIERRLQFNAVVFHTLSSSLDLSVLRPNHLLRDDFLYKLFGQFNGWEKNMKTIDGFKRKTIISVIIYTKE